MKALLRFLWPIDQMDQVINELRIEVENLTTENERVKSLLADRAFQMDRPLMPVVLPCVACEERRISELNRTGEEKRDLEKSNDAQAARSMSRQTKQHFVAYQAAVKQILDRANDLGKQNHVTKEDLRKFRQLRDDLSAQLGRSI